MTGLLIFSIVFSLVLVAFAYLSKLKVRNNLTHIRSLIYSVGFGVVVLSAWLFVTADRSPDPRIVSKLILPSPVEVISSFPTLHTQQELTRSIVISFKRVLMGFSIAVIFAVGLGICMGAFSEVKAFFKPLSLVTSYVPIVVFVPLTLAWWGGSETQKVGFLFIACAIALLPMVISSVEKVDEAYLDSARTKGASQWQLATKILIPVALPDIWNSIRVTYGIGWTWIVLAEVVNSQRGVGYLMSLGEKRSRTEWIFASAIVIIVMAIICDKLWKIAGDKIFKYKVR